MKTCFLATGEDFFAKCDSLEQAIEAAEQQRGGYAVYMAHPQTKRTQAGYLRHPLGAAPKLLKRSQATA